MYNVSLPSSMKTRGFLADKTEIIPDMARVIVKENGAIRTAYPYSSAYPSGKGK